MAKQSLRAESARDNILTFKPRPRPLRTDVPAFNPANPAHLRAWEALWDLGQVEARHGKA
jgi:hypothetical protein